MNLSARELAAFLGVSARSVGRWRAAGLLNRLPNHTYELHDSIQRLLAHFMMREKWAFAQLRRFKIFNERTGDIFEHRRGAPHD